MESNGRKSEKYIHNNKQQYQHAAAKNVDESRTMNENIVIKYSENGHEPSENGSRLRHNSKIDPRFMFVLNGICQTKQLPPNKHIWG